jgi:choline dehydrogenase-like flavoprotein
MSDAGPVVVIGTGPPGAIAALFLARAGADVLVLDAGSGSRVRGLTVRARGFTVFKVRPRLRRREGVLATADPQASLFEEIGTGGLSNQWSCAVPRFAPEDFADASRAGEVFEWPIGYKDLAPWYERVEPLLHIAGGRTSYPQLPAGAIERPRELAPQWAPIVSAAAEAGRTLAPMPYAYGARTTITLGGTPFNAFVRLVQPELRAHRLSARFETRVERLEWSSKARRVEAIHYQDRFTGSTGRLRCRAVVLAAGAIGTPEILLSSTGADFPEGLGNTNGVLGRYLHDHPIGKLVVELDSPLPFHPPSYLTRPALERSPALYAAACMQWSGADMVVRSVLRGQPGRTGWLGFSVFGTMAPTPDDCIALNEGARGADGKRGLRLHIRHPPEARQALDAARDDLLGILARAKIGARVRLWNVEPPCNSVHYAGTCRMHTSPRFGMVDRWSRLHAASNVVVADSSVFTTGPEKNPVLTSMALAARAVARLGEELKAGDL